MKGFIKALTLCLALALVISALAIFAGAATSADVTVKSYYDFSEESTSLTAVINNKAPVGGKDAPGGRVDVATATVVDGENPYCVFTVDLTEFAPKVEEYNAANGTTFNPMIPLANPYMTVSAGNVKVGGSSRAVEYVVFDIDIATDSEFLSDFTFNTVVRNSSGAMAGNRSSFTITGKNVHDGFAVKSPIGGKNGTDMYPITAPQGDWINLTVVIDCADTANKGTSYYYLDGYYVGKQVKFLGTNGDGVTFESVRFNVAGQSVAFDNLVASLAFDNASLKCFPLGYSGNIKGNLGSTNVQLDQISELSYFDDDMPATLEVKAPSYTVKRGDQTLYANSNAELEKLLVAGDEVTVNRNIKGTVLVIPENVTFACAEGKSFTYSTVTLAELKEEVGADPDYVIRDAFGAILAKGEQVQTNDEGDTDSYVDSGDTDALGTAITSLTGSYKRVQLLDDIKYGWRVSVSGVLIFDLNGHKLNINAKKIGTGEWHTFVFTENSRLFIRGGDLDINISGCSLSNFNAASAYLVLADLGTYNHNEGTIDHRSGMLIFKDIDQMNVTSKSWWFYRLFSRNTDGTLTSMLMENVKADLGEAYMLTQNLSTSGNKYGGANLLFKLRNVELDSDNTPIRVDFYADTSGTCTNNNKFMLMADNCTFNAATSVVKVAAASTADGMVNDVSVITAGSVFNSPAIIENTMDAVYGEPRVSLAEGTLLASPEVDGFGCEVTFDGEVVRTNSHPGFPLIVSKDYHTFVWDRCGELYEEPWYKNEIPAMEEAPVELPTATDTYYYSWVLSESGDCYVAEPHAKSIELDYSLTLDEDLYLNVYIPASANVKSVTVGGKSAILSEVNVDGIDYVKATSSAVKATNAGKDFAIKANVYAYGIDTIELTAEVNVLNYCEQIINGTDAELASAKPLVCAIVDLIDSAYRFAGKSSSTVGYRLLAIKLSDGYKASAVALDEADIPAAVNTMANTASAVESVKLLLGARPSLWFNFTEGFTGSVTFSYGEGDGLVTETVEVVDGEGAYALALTAPNLCETVTVTVSGGEGDLVGQYNLSAYLGFARTMEDGTVAALVRSLVAYSVRAAEYAASVN